MFKTDENLRNNGEQVIKAMITAALMALGVHLGTEAPVFAVVASRFTADNGGVCSAAIETVGGHLALPKGGCWLHSHPDEQNVYDFTKYASVAIHMHIYVWRWPQWWWRWWWWWAILIFEAARTKQLYITT